MRGIVLVSAILMACAITGWGQAYYESSGQTQVFTLAAGAKIGPSAIKSTPALRTGINNGISVGTSRGSIVVALPALHRGVADIALYDIKGRQIYRQSGFLGTSLRLETKAIAPGVYSMLVRVDGKSYTRRVAVNGRGE